MASIRRGQYRNTGNSRPHLRTVQEEEPNLRLGQNQILSRQNDAAIVIQSHYRGYRVRKLGMGLDVEDLESENGESEHLNDEREYPYDEDHEEAATVIQAHYRGFRARKELLDSGLLDSLSPPYEDSYTDHAATTIQSHNHCYKVRSNGKTSESQKVGIKTSQDSTMSLQAYRDEAATVIQSNYKGYRVRKQYQEYQDAAVTIQSNFRGYRVRNQLSNSTNTEHLGGRHQCEIKRESNSNVIEYAHVHGRHLTPSSQPGICVSSNSSRDARLRHGADVTSFRQNKRPKEKKFSYNNPSSGKISSKKETDEEKDVCPAEHYEVQFERKKTRKRINEEKNAATQIQASWRGHKVRGQMKAMKQAAAKIQSTYRGFRMRKMLLNGEYELDDIPNTVSFLNFETELGDPISEDKEETWSRHTSKMSINPCLKMSKHPPKQNQTLAGNPDNRSGSGALECQVNKETSNFRQIKKVKFNPNDDYQVSANTLPFVDSLQYRQMSVPDVPTTHKTIESRKQYEGENTAASHIQASSKDNQTSKQLSKESVAATSIQSMFRGYKTRQELQGIEITGYCAGGPEIIEEEVGEVKIKKRNPTPPAATPIGNIQTNTAGKGIPNSRRAPVSIQVTRPSSQYDEYKEIPNRSRYSKHTSTSGKVTVKANVED